VSAAPDADSKLAAEDDNDVGDGGDDDDDGDDNDDDGGGDGDDDDGDGDGNKSDDGGPASLSHRSDALSPADAQRPRRRKKKSTVAPPISAGFVVVSAVPKRKNWSNPAAKRCVSVCHCMCVSLHVCACVSVCASLYAVRAVSINPTVHVDTGFCRAFLCAAVS
jgi:hypothetical protein